MTKTVEIPGNNFGNQQLTRISRARAIGRSNVRGNVNRVAEAAGSYLAVKDYPEYRIELKLPFVFEVTDEEYYILQKLAKDPTIGRDYLLQREIIRRELNKKT